MFLTFVFITQDSALQQPLAHLYYSVVMEKLQFESSKFDLTVLINHASKITHEVHAQCGMSLDNTSPHLMGYL